MTRFPPAMWYHDGDESPGRMVVGAMTPPLIEKHETLIPQERIHLCKSKIAG
jgi:hypothetical protein